MKREGLSLFQAKREAQQIADDTEQPVHIYPQHSATGVKHFGLVTDRDSTYWQRAASTRCKYPREA